MKKLAAAVIAVLMCVVSIGSTALAAEPVKIIVKDQQIKTDTAPIVEQGRVLVPIRAITESLGATVEWDPKTKTAKVHKWSETVSLTVGRKKAVIEGNSPYLESNEALLDVSVKLVNNRVFVPLRFVSQHYGYRVDWSNNTVYIQSPLSKSKQDILYTGELASSRKLAIELLGPNVYYLPNLHYLQKPLRDFYDNEAYDIYFLFPEGEALGFFFIDWGEVISWVEFQDDFPVVTWQGRIQDGQGKAMQRFLSGQLTEQWGELPAINKAFFTYGSGYFGASSWKECGRLEPDGAFTQTGYYRDIGEDYVTNEIGTIEYKLPDEERVD